MKPLTICVTYIAKQDMRDKFISEVLDSNVLDKIRHEDGCLSYKYYLSIENDNEIFLLEKWTSKDCQKVHMTQPHMDVLKEIKNKYIEETSIEQFD